MTRNTETKAINLTAVAPRRLRLTVHPAGTMGAQPMARLVLHETEEYASPEIWAGLYDASSPRAKEEIYEKMEMALIRLDLAEAHILPDER